MCHGIASTKVAGYGVVGAELAARGDVGFKSYEAYTNRSRYHMPLHREGPIQPPCILEATPLQVATREGNASRMIASCFCWLYKDIAMPLLLFLLMPRSAPQGLQVNLVILQ